MTNKPRDIESIVHGVRPILDHAEREAYLAEACAGDVVLRARVETLLAAEAKSGSSFANVETLEAPSSAGGRRPSTGAVASGSEQLGTVLGRYKLLERLGEGGFGEVYLAEQREPVQRNVALKIIKLGMHTRDVIARFEQERQALAMMDHPNIAKVLDAGVTDTGRPYFVMELVKGMPITDYCDERNMSLRDRLKLFIQVCSAVQHAHLKGIIHRDIKPNNVLVTHVDEKPVPKVIDFGIAKATQQKLTEHTMFTQLGQFMGTPAYMSPEQADPLGLDIDTRSDIYSLGVLLYELLTGVTPFEIKTLRAAALDEVKRIIRDQDPPRPSTRLSTLGVDLPTVAKQRGLEPKKLGIVLRGDLDWIIMRAMEKDRTRRYETATDFARDIERYLNQEPVAAGPPSASYRTRKFVRRHRTGVAAATVAVVTLVSFAGTMTVQAKRIAAERDRANQERVLSDRVVDFQTDMLQEIKPLKLGESIAAELRVRIDGALTSNGTSDEQRQASLASLDAMLGGVNLTDTARNILDINILTPATKAAEAQFNNQPQVEARLQHALAETYRAIGLPNKALPYAERALRLRHEQLGDDHRDTLRPLILQAVILWDLDRNAESGAILEKAIANCERTFGAEDKDTLVAKMSLTILSADRGMDAQARKEYEELLKIQERVLGPEHRDVATTLSNLGATLMDLHREVEAVPILERAVNIRLKQLGPDDPATLFAMRSLAKAYASQGRNDEALRMQFDAMQRLERVRGTRHPDTVLAVADLAELYKKQGRYKDAEPIARKAVELNRATWGNLHRRTLDAVADLGITLSMLGRHDEAEALHIEAYEGSKAAFGPDDPVAMNRLNNLAVHYWYLGRYQRASELFAESLESTKRRFGEGNPETAQSMTNLAVVHTKLGRLDEAQALLNTALAIRTKAYGPEHRETLETKVSLAGLAAERGDHAEAEREYRELIAIQRKVLGVDHPLTLESENNLGLMYRRMGRNADAEPVLTDVLPRRRAAIGPSHPETLDTASELASLYVETGREKEARPLLVEVIAARRAAASPENASPAQLNACAWILLTCPIEERRNPDEALILAKRANEATNSEDAAMLSTLARALFDTKNVDEAIVTQQKALALLPDGSPERDGYEARLSEYAGAAPVSAVDPVRLDHNDGLTASPER